MTYLLQRLLWYDMWLYPLRPLKTMSTMCQKSKEKYASCVIVPYWYSNLVYYALDTIFSCNRDCSSYNSLCKKKNPLKKVHSNLDIANKSVIPFLFPISSNSIHVKCNMLSKSSKWEQGFVHYISIFTILRFAISGFEYST